MPKPRRDPYVPMDATIRRNAKMAALPSDAARLGWLYVGLGDAKLQRPSGCFRSRAHWTEVAGRFARFLKDYLAAGLIEEVPRLCARCRIAWPGIADGTLIVHDWKRHNCDPGAADRAADWRNEDRSNGIDDQIERPLNGDQTGIERNANADLARDPAGPRGGNRKGNRNRNVASTSTGNGAGAVDNEGPLLTKTQLDAWRSFGSEWGAFKTAWLERGLKLPPSGEPDEEGSQRATLHPIVDAWPNDVAVWIRSAPNGASGRDVVGHIISCYREATAGVSDETPEWLAGPSKGEATETVGAILGRMAS